MKKADPIDAAIEAVTIPVMQADFMLHDGRQLMIKVPQDFDAIDFVTATGVLIQLLQAADQVRAQRASGGLIVPDKRIVRPS